MVHGTYRTVFKVEGSTGGACAGFFWYHVSSAAFRQSRPWRSDPMLQDDTSEIDIEIVTAGDSIVNDTINFTLHPSLAPDGSPIPQATASRPLSDTGFHPERFHEYRFDCHPDLGVDYYVDGKHVHSNDHNVPSQGGTLQVKLWADGNKWWSGRPSTSDVFMTIKSIVAYYNTSRPDAKWLEGCDAAGGPSPKTICTIR